MFRVLYDFFAITQASKNVVKYQMSAVANFRAAAGGRPEATAKNSGEKAV